MQPTTSNPSVALEAIPDSSKHSTKPVKPTARPKATSKPDVPSDVSLLDL